LKNTTCATLPVTGVAVEYSFGSAELKQEGAPVHPDEIRLNWTFDPKFTQEEIDAFLVKQQKAYDDWKVENNNNRM